MLRYDEAFNGKSADGDIDCVFQRLESGVQSYARSFPAVFAEAKGTEIWDISGTRYLDFLSGAGSLNYGHNHPVLKKALLQYIESDDICNSLDLHTSAKQRFLETLENTVFRPRSLDYLVQFTGPTGTNAVEAALKIARKATGRHNVVAFTNGFHGVTFGSLAATGNSCHRNGGGLPLAGTTRMPYEGYLGADVDTIAYFEKMLRDPSSGLDHPAAVLVEAVQGEGGHRAASNEWLQALERLCRAFDILLIVDEIQTGCGRTGTFFGFEPSGISPDIIAVSKSISGYGLPLALTLLKPELDLWKPGEHNGTFRGNNMAFVTATATLEHFWADGAFETEIDRKSTLLDARLNRILETNGERIVEARGRGLMRGLQFRDPDDAARVTAYAYETGLIAERVGSHDEVVKFMSPLTISDAHLNEGLDIFEQAVDCTSSTISIRSAS